MSVFYSIFFSFWKVDMATNCNEKEWACLELIEGHRRIITFDPIQRYVVIALLSSKYSLYSESPFFLIQKYSAAPWGANRTEIGSQNTSNLERQ